MKRIGKTVAPLAGAWIEIPLVKEWADMLLVAPLAGAWIEISDMVLHFSDSRCRSPRGSVD